MLPIEYYNDTDICRCGDTLTEHLLTKVSDKYKIRCMKCTCTEFNYWSGMCPSGKHGLDYYSQPCDLCDHDNKTPFHNPETCRQCKREKSEQLGVKPVSSVDTDEVMTMDMSISQAIASLDERFALRDLLPDHMKDSVNFNTESVKVLLDYVKSHR